MNATSGDSSAPFDRHEHDGTHPETGPVFHMASWARTVREQHRLSRPQADKTTGISWEYLKDIENNDVIPREVYLDKFITGYHLDDAQARLTRELCQPPARLPPVHHLRTRISTPARLHLLTRLDPSGIALAYLDPLWNILTANTTFFGLFPGTGASATDNLARWALPPAPEPSPAESILLHPRREARWIVGTLRTAFARYRDDPRVPELYQQLSRNEIFHDYWHNDIHVAYGRCNNQPLHLRDPDTHQPYTLNIQLTALTDIPEIRGFLAWTEPDPD